MSRYYLISPLLLGLSSWMLVLPAHAQVSPIETHATTGTTATSTSVSFAEGSSLPSSLSSLLVIALRDRPEMRAAILRSDAARERIRQAAARYYPTIDLLMTAQNTSLYDTFSGITATGTIQGQPLLVDVARTSPKYTVNPTLQFSHDLYTGGRDTALLRNAEITYQADRLNAELQTREVMRDVTLRYLRLGQVWFRWKTAQRWADVARKQEHATKNRFNAGKASDIEVKTNAFTRAQRELNVQLASQDIGVAYAEFFRALGQSSDVLMPPPEDLALIFQDFVRELGLLETRDATPLDGAESVRTIDEPEFKRANALAEAARELVTAEGASHLPQVKFLAQYIGVGRSDASLGSAFNDTRKNSFVIGLSATFNLFSGFSTQARVTEAQLNAKRMLEEAVGVHSRLQAARQTLTSAHARAKAQLEYAYQRSQLEMLRLKVAQAKLEAGRGFNEDVEQAQMSILQADADIFDKRIDLIASQIKLKFTATKDVNPEGQP